MAQEGPSSARKPQESTLGAVGRIGHLAFPTFGRDSSITPLEIRPYVISDAHFVFGDARGFVSNHGQFGGNFGLGYRYLDEGLMSWYGGSFWYDVDDTSDLLFHQVGLSFEAMIEGWEVRSNMYLPVGDTRKAHGAAVLDARFVGNQILFDSTRSFGTAMKGVDIELGYGVPLDVLGWDSTVRGFVGGYFFDGSSVDNINGFKTRGELVLNNFVTTQIAYTTDQTFGDNVMVGMQFEFPWGASHPSSSWRRRMPSPYRAVERNYNVIVSQSRIEERDLVAINPETGQAWEVQHVSGGGSSGAGGTYADPFATVAQAQAAGADLIYVHGNTVLGDAITLSDGQHLMGEGAGNFLRDLNRGTFALPNTLAAGAQTPRLTGVAGPAITLGDNSSVSNFVIDGITGDGIVGNGASGAAVTNVRFSGITGDALRLTNAGGTVSLAGLQFLNTPGRGVVVDGGNANVTLTGSFTNVGGDAVTFSNMTGGSIQMGQLGIIGGGDRGVVMSGLAADVTIRDLTVRDSQGDAVVIEGSSGNVFLEGLTRIENSLARGLVLENLTGEKVSIKDIGVTSTAAADAIHIDNVDGEIAIDKLTLDLQNGRGLVADDAESLIVKAGSIKTTNAAAVDIEDSTIQVQLSSLSVDGGPVGIRLNDVEGSFALAGALNTSVIKNAVTAVLLEDTGTVVLQGVNLTDNTHGIVSRGTDYLVLDRAQVTGTTQYALDSMNDRLVSITNSLIQNNGSIGGGSVRIAADTFGTYQTQILRTTITDANGTPVLFESLAGAEGSTLGVLMQNSVINANRGGASALKIDWNGPIGLTMDANQITLTESNMTAVDVRGTSATDKLTALIIGTAVNVDGANGRGFHIDAASTSSLNFVGNAMGFNGGNGVGYHMKLNGVAEVALSGNYLVDNAFGGTGVLVDSIAANSSFAFNNNNFEFKSTGLLVDRGIVFSSAGETIQLSGSSNSISGATTIFTAPAGKTTGRIRINGTDHP
ncbi:MAG: right-handed parallel beta-helix repeat-containing protein [Planctomyces sp.]|nr:right-handed parallel beta-helix repeat-containing protein [Planctomyces sp.]